MLRNNLAKLMIDRGISATQLFNDTGIARSTISKISNNKTDKFSLQTIDKICNYIEVSPSDFFDFWDYDVQLKTGFTNFDSVQEVKEHWGDSSKYSEPCFLLIEFKRGKNTKKLLEYTFNYKYEFDPTLPDDLQDGTGWVDDLELVPTSEVAIINDMPVQFKNELIEQIKELLCSTFDVYEKGGMLKELDVLALSGIAHF